MVSCNFKLSLESILKTVEVNISSKIFDFISGRDILMINSWIKSIYLDFYVYFIWGIKSHLKII